MKAQLLARAFSAFTRAPLRAATLALQEQRGANADGSVRSPSAQSFGNSPWAALSVARGFKWCFQTGTFSRVLHVVGEVFSSLLNPGDHPFLFGVLFFLRSSPAVPGSGGEAGQRE